MATSQVARPRPANRRTPRSSGRSYAEAAGGKTNRGKPTTPRKRPAPASEDTDPSTTAANVASVMNTPMTDSKPAPDPAPTATTPAKNNNNNNKKGGASGAGRVPGQQPRRKRQRKTPWAETMAVRTLENGKEPDEHRIAQRRKQIEIGKNNLAYDKFSRKYPRNRRRRGDPMTPNVEQVCSKRSWAGQLNSWKHGFYAAVARMEEREVKAQRKAQGLPVDESDDEKKGKKRRNNKKNVKEEAKKAPDGAAAAADGKKGSKKKGAKKEEEKRSVLNGIVDRTGAPVVDPNDPAGEKADAKAATGEDSSDEEASDGFGAANSADDTRPSSEVTEEMEVGGESDWDDSDVELDGQGNEIGPEVPE